LYDDSGLPDLVAYGAALQPNIGDAGGDFFIFEFWPNGGEGARTGTFQLGQGDDADYATCARCFFVVTDGPNLFATSGTLVISNDSTPMSGVIRATLTDATFVEVTIDPSTAHSTPVPGGRCASVGAFEFSAGF
jgi:hypothetical protein